MLKKITITIFISLIAGGLFYYQFHIKRLDKPLCNPSQNQQQCWEAQIDFVLEKSLDQAFEVLAGLYATEPAFAAQCHSYVHKLGEAAYEKFSRRQDLKLSGKTSYCGFGFYHGFMETLLHSGGSMSEAREFCAGVGLMLKEQTGDAEGACYHGIGHGFVDGSDPTAWGSVQKIIAPGLKFCGEVADSDYNKNRCASGVFNSLAIMYSSKQYELSADEKTVFQICNAQSQPYFKKPCYEEMNTFLLGLGRGQFSQAAKIVEKIPDRSYAPAAIQSLAGAGAIYGQPKMTHEQMIDACEILRSDLILPCIRGFVGGIIEGGTPGKESEAALDFCKANSSFTQRSACFDRMLSYLSVIYPQERFSVVCSQVKDHYKSSYCQQYPVH